MANIDTFYLNSNNNSEIPVFLVPLLITVFIKTCTRLLDSRHKPSHMASPPDARLSDSLKKSYFAFYYDSHFFGSFVSTRRISIFGMTVLYVSKSRKHMGYFSESRDARISSILVCDIPDRTASTWILCELVNRNFSGISVIRIIPSL